MSLQRTPEWRAERAGCATASEFSNVLAKIKSGEAAVRRNYRMQLVTERLTGNPVVGYVNAVMLRGIEMEPEARIAYEAERGAIVEEVGFVRHPRIENCGASPDGYVGDDGLAEFKCPESTTHLAYLEAARIPPEHLPQLQGQLAVTGRRWVDFVSYDPRFPPGLQLFIIRVERDEDYIKLLEAEVKTFLAEVDAMVERLMKRAA